MKIHFAWPKSFSTFAFTASSILISGGQRRLKPSPGCFFFASMPSLLPPVPQVRDRWVVEHVGRAFGEDAVAQGSAVYSFFGTATGAGSIAGAGAGGVSATGASCQWPCSTDHTLPGGASPGGCGAGVN